MRQWLRLGVLLALSASNAWTIDWKARYPKPEGYISDFAHVIDPVSKNRLEAYAAGLEQATGAQMALVTVPSLSDEPGQPPEPIEDVANTLFRAWGIGQKGKDSGIMMLLSIGDHRSRLEVGYGLEPIIPDGVAGDVLRAMRPSLRQNDFGDAMVAAAQTIGSTIAHAKNVTLQTQLPARRVRPSVTDRIPWPIILGGFFLILLLIRSGGPRGYGGGGGGGLGVLPWLLLGNMMGGRSSWGSRGSGGFGGFDSGDGFGGFGGGDSGGGGASSSW